MEAHKEMDWCIGKVSSYTAPKEHAMVDSKRESQLRPHQIRSCSPLNLTALCTCSHNFENPNMDKKVLVMLLLVVCCYGADPSDETATDDDNGGSNADGNEGGDNDGNDEVTSEPEPEPEDDGPKPRKCTMLNRWSLARGWSV